MKWNAMSVAATFIGLLVFDHLVARVVMVVAGLIAMVSMALDLHDARRQLQERRAMDAAERAVLEDALAYLRRR